MDDPPMKREDAFSRSSRPKLKDKLLGKPPFRFLFDCITATGFSEGLGGPIPQQQGDQREADEGGISKRSDAVGIAMGSPSMLALERLSLDSSQRERIFFECLPRRTKL